MSISLTLKITVCCNLVILNVCKYFSLLAILQFASVRCPRSFWIPGPSLRSMATARLVRPGSHPRIIISDSYSPFTRPSRDCQSPEGRVTLSPPLAGQLQRRSVLFMRRKSLRPRKVGAQPPALRALGHPRL